MYVTERATMCLSAAESHLHFGGIEAREQRCHASNERTASDSVC